MTPATPGRRLHQLRIHTLRTAEALWEYATVQWPRHIPSLRAFGVTTHWVWTDHNAGAHRLIARLCTAVGPPPVEGGQAFRLAL